MKETSQKQIDPAIIDAVDVATGDYQNSKPTTKGGFIARLALKIGLIIAKIVFTKRK